MVEVWSPGEPLTRLVAALDEGAVLAVPTESSYGLAVRPDDDAAVRRVFEIKGRDRGMPLPVVAAGVEDLRSLGVDVDGRLARRCRDLWPAALTAVLPLGRDLAAAAGGSTLAVRIPAHDLLRDVLETVGPLTATSANRSGEDPVLDLESMRRLLTGVPSVVLDGGTLPGGPPSTLVVERDGRFEVLRQGRVDFFSAAAVEISEDRSC